VKQTAILSISILLLVSCGNKSVREASGPFPLQPATTGQTRADTVFSLMQQDRNLSGLNLSGMEMDWMDLSGVRIIRSTMNNASLHGTCLREALISDTSMVGVDMVAADCRNARLIRTDLHGSRLVKSDFSDALMIQVDLSFTDLTDICLRGASITGCIISKKWKGTLESSGLKKLEEIIWVE